jgi:hypothetical protein
MPKSIDLGPLLVVNPRHFICANAELELEEKLLDLSRQHDLTPSEQFMMLSKITLSLSQRCVATERRKNNS